MSDAMMQSYEAVKSVATALNIEVNLFNIYTEENASQLALLWTIAKSLISKAALIKIEITNE